MHIFLSSPNPQVFGKAGHMLDSFILMKREIEDKAGLPKFEVSFLKINDKPIELTKQISILQSPSLVLGY